MKGHMAPVSRSVSDARQHYLLTVQQIAEEQKRR